MNKEVKAKWVTALRSGDYPQAQGYLRKEEGYCCLGVLCQVAANEGVIPQPQWNGQAYVYSSEMQQAVAYPHAKVVEWAGLGTDNPYVTVNGDERESLVDLNDNGSTFGEIADLIDAQL